MFQLHTVEEIDVFCLCAQQRRKRGGAALLPVIAQTVYLIFNHVQSDASALSLGVFCWLGVIKPIDTYIAEHQSHAQKIKKDIKWMQDQASTHGLLGHPALTQPIKNILLEEAKRENLAITLENGPDNTLTIHPVTAPLENVSRWLTTAQVTYGIVIEDLQFTLAGNEEITLRHLSFREQQ